MPLFLAAYSTIFASELIGDKLLYTLSVVVITCGCVPVLWGVGPAFVGKMFAALLLGGLIAQLEAKIVAARSAITFFAMMLALSFRRTNWQPVERGTEHSSRASVVSITAVSVSEWGDMERVAAATRAMVAKAALAVTIRTGLADGFRKESCCIAAAACYSA